MKLAAIYIENHDYLFDKPQTINFGSKYLYTFNKEESNVFITRKENENFINDFFNNNNSKVKLTLLNAIVGQNGAGKSTILDIIRSSFITHGYALDSSSVVVLFENNKDYPIIYRNDFDNVYLDGETPINLIAISKTKKKVKTIYYSPHLDYKFNPNFDNLDDHDISLESIIDQDLKNTAKRDLEESGLPFKITQELLFKNSIRQLNFLNSKIVKNNKIFKTVFQLPEHGLPLLIIRGYVIAENEWNTPNAFRSILRLIKDKNELEEKNWYKERDKGLDQLGVNKYLLKRNIIGSIISSLYFKMEGNNAYLMEGELAVDNFEEKTELLNSHETLNWFIENSSLKIGGKAQKIFDGNEIRDLVAKLYNSIDEATNEGNVSKNSIYVKPQDAKEILELQREYLRALFKYYHLFERDRNGLILEHSDRMEGFVNYMPTGKKLSSGEIALLNLFSRLYDFINSNLDKNNRFYEICDHYLILLDEGDSGFHPTWKKHYVKSLIATLPHFFEQLENKPTIQIIFTTHDPLTLSDIPNSNVIYLRKNESGSEILEIDNPNRPNKTFGANISELLSDSFFIEGSLIGDFAFEKIREAIDWLESQKQNNSEYYKKLIKIIDEPIVQRKLAEMFDNKMNQLFQRDIIDMQIEKLQNLKKRMK